MNRSVKYATTGVVLIVAGLVLNEFAMWYYYQSILSQYGAHPPPIAPILGTGFLILVPIGIVLLGCSMYLFFIDYRVVVERKASAT
ncbi:MAG: hypothetical protein ACFFED_00520 [Candidatus Thorarchaeota archaeon]